MKLQNFSTENNQPNRRRLLGAVAPALLGAAVMSTAIQGTASADSGGTSISPDYRKKLDSFFDKWMVAFNTNDLDSVMTMIHPEAEYRAMNGNNAVGHRAIRNEFQPQFDKLYGRLEFLTEFTIYSALDQNVVTLGWACMHHTDDPSTNPLYSVVPPGEVALFGPNPAWEGVDVIVLKDNLVYKKRTYGRALIPLLVRGQQIVPLY